LNRLDAEVLMKRIPAEFGRHRFGIMLVLLMLIATSIVPISSQAGPSTKLYIGHAARLTAQIPTDWTVDPEGDFDYIGDDGYVASAPIGGSSLEEICSTETLQTNGVVVSNLLRTTWNGIEGCRVSSSRGEVTLESLIVPHPHPFDYFGTSFAFAIITADPAHFDAIVSSVDFSPELVTPELYIKSVVEIIKARAYFSSNVDWDVIERSAISNIESAPSMTMASAVLNDLMNGLRGSGDTHSFLMPAGQSNQFTTAIGYGLLISGNRVAFVYEGSAAAKAGLRTGDIIERVNGRELQEENDLVDLYYLGESSIAVTVRREGELQPLELTIEATEYERYLPPSGQRLKGDIGYIAVPGFSVFDRRSEFVNAGRKLFESIDQSPTCGWVVDLRFDTGGSYSPMISAVAPLMENGPFVGWESASGTRSWVRYEDGKILDEDFLVADYFAGNPYDLADPLPPVAVLTSSRTASAGEAATLAFVGRPNTKSFGETTGGYATAIQGIPLFDGSAIGLAVSAMIDRTGATHLDGIVPDVSVPVDWTNYGTETDPVINAAVDWLLSQPGCAAATPVAAD
jgi:C-terminal processing protease CtpA/Prc